MGEEETLTELRQSQLCARLQVSGVYKKDMEKFPEQILSFLEEKHQSVCSAIRVAFCRALILMRHRKLLQPLSLLSAALRLVVSRDKSFRRMLVKYFVADVKALNSARRDDRLNRKLQVGADAIFALS